MRNSPLPPPPHPSAKNPPPYFFLSPLDPSCLHVCSMRRLLRGPMGSEGSRRGEARKLIGRERNTISPGSRLYATAACRRLRWRGAGWGSAAAAAAPGFGPTHFGRRIPERPPLPPSPPHPTPGESCVTPAHQPRLRSRVKTVFFLDIEADV